MQGSTQPTQNGAVSVLTRETLPVLPSFLYLTSPRPKASRDSSQLPAHPFLQNGQSPLSHGEGDNDKVVFVQNCDRMKEKAMAGDEATPRVRKGKANAYIAPEKACTHIAPVFHSFHTD